VRENALVEQVQALERRLLSVEFSAKTEPPSLKRRASSPPPLVARTGANAAFEQSAIELEELGAFPLFFHLVTASPLTKLICPLFYSSRVKEHGLSLILSSLRRVSWSRNSQSADETLLPSLPSSPDYICSSCPLSNRRLSLLTSTFDDLPSESALDWCFKLYWDEVEWSWHSQSPFSFLQRFSQYSPWSILQSFIVLPLKPK
jgi:hypothetical protein